MKHSISNLERPERVLQLEPAVTIERMGIQEGQLVADIGAGTGIFTLPIGEKTKHTVYAIDVDEALLSVVAEKSALKKIENIQCMKVAGFEYDLPDGHLDFALMVTVFHEIEEKQALLKEIYRVLKFNGKLGMIEFHKRETPIGPPLDHRIGFDEVKEICEENGFALAETFTIGDSFYCTIFRKKITHPMYKDYPEQPYISPERNLKLWEEEPENFPYNKVEKKQMIRLSEGILPGHLIMLWRVHFNTFNTESIIPEYFEYRYGVDSHEAINILLEKGYIEKLNAKASLDALNIKKLKKILESNGLSTQGKKEDLMKRIQGSLSEEIVSQAFRLRKYKITLEGKTTLNNHSDIIKRHGTKK